MAHTRDSWTKYHISNEMDDEFEESANADKQPKFKKYRANLTLEGFLTDDFGLIFSHTNTRSIIPLKTYSSNYGGTKYKAQKSKQRRNIDNYFIKGLWYATDRLTITPSITYAPQTAKVYRSLAKDSFMDQKSGGVSLSLNTDYEFDFAKMRNQISYSKLETSRDSENQYSTAWQYSTSKDWGNPASSSFEGAFGDVNQVQKTLSYKADFDFNEFNALWATHKFATGLEIQKQEAFYEIPKEFIAVGQPRTIGTGSCAGIPYCSEGKTRSGWRGQFLALKQVYGPGKINAKQNSYAFYLEDKMDFGRLTIRPGVRFNADDYMNKKTIAPRFSASFDLFDNSNTVLNFGKNRYYGRNLFAYRLNDGKKTLVKSYRRATLSAPFLETTEVLKSDTKFSELKIPYDDETSYGITQKFDNFALAFKYIKRKGRDQIMRATAKSLGIDCGNGYLKPAGCYLYTNNGKSDTSAYNIALRTIEPLKLYGTNHSFEISYDHFKTKTNATNYTTSEGTVEREIYYKGNIIRYGDLPVSNFTRPWSIRLTTVSQAPRYGLTLSNFLIYKASMNATVNTGKITIGRKDLDLYKDVNLGKSFSWDMRVGYVHKLPKAMDVFVNLDIYNILNKSNKSSTVSSSQTTLLYEAGRQFWLEVGLRW